MHSQYHPANSKLIANLCIKLDVHVSYQFLRIARNILSFDLGLRGFDLNL
jgi:hypothetical protein